MHACLAESSVAHRLISLGAKLNLTDAKGNTAVIYSVISDDYHVTSSLLKNGANPNYINQENRSALFYVFREDPSYLFRTKHQYRIEMIRLLVTSGADPNICLKDNHSYFKEIVEDGHLGLATTLLDHGYSYQSKAEEDLYVEKTAKLKTSEIVGSSKEHAFGVIGNTFICSCGNRAKIGIKCKCGKLYTRMPGG